MMKNFLLVIISCVFFSSFAYAQKDNAVSPKLPVNEETRLITYNEKIETPGLSGKDLFSKALTWASTYYKNPGDVIREKDETSGSIVIKARFRIYNEPDKKGTVTAAGDVMYTMVIDTRDGAYRYTINKFNWQQTSAFPAERWMDTAARSYLPVYAHFLKQTDDQMKELVASFTKKMAATDSRKKDDW